jgi:hypothetical protein
MKEKLSSSESSVLTRATSVTSQKTPFLNAVEFNRNVLMFRRNLLAHVQGRRVKSSTRRRRGKTEGAEQEASEMLNSVPAFYSLLLLFRP